MPKLTRFLFILSSVLALALLALIPNLRQEPVAQPTATPTTCYVDMHSEPTASGVECWLNMDRAGFAYCLKEAGDAWRTAIAPRCDLIYQATPSTPQWRGTQ